MNPILARWNALNAEAAASEVLPCCGSRVWARALTAKRPFADEDLLFKAAGDIWRALPESDWREAFDSHPRMGQQHAPSATAQSLAWSAQEQSKATPDEAAKRALAEANRRYEDRFGRIFIVCAIGKTSSEILSILESRMNNDDATELREAAEQQRQITQLRLRRWLEAN
jgi:2-oxo-4-hydroxy-4-carboxy-5-ureidoimidazoline decarboxylase